MIAKLSADGSVRRGPDRLIVEEPMEIRLDDTLVTTTMRTPGHDFELAVGFLWAEGLLADAAVTEVRYCATGSAVETEFNVVSVGTGGRAPTPTPRLTTTTAACGVCGSASLEELTERWPTVQPLDVAADVLMAVAERAAEQQELFAETGAVHAAASFDASGEIGVVREDVGRHNAVDKVVGRMLLDGQLPAAGLGLYVSGRASFEVVQKAWAAGFGLVLSVSAPSSLAVDTATQANLALHGFLRPPTLNRY